ncbi:MAG: ATP-binding cassette domain-containing protein [Candidatus Poseidoniaceae archaeon]|nr:ATP-binding cassette domain-containing protein [Candidatus Poseidoniaceae archaeon]
MSDVLLTFESVEIRRGMSIVVSDFSLTVSSGEVVALHGENGCGKSTIIEAAARLLSIEKGQISQHGKMVIDSDGRRVMPTAPFGLTLQQNGLVGSDTISEHLKNMMSICKMKTNLAPILSQYSLDHRSNDLIAHLSGGQQRKVSVIAGLLPAMISKSPRLILLDEPDAGLDDNSIQTLCQHITSLRLAGHAFLIATHDERILKCATRINDLKQDIEQNPTDGEAWKIPEVEVATANNFIKVGFGYNFKTKAGFANNGIAGLLTLGILLSLVEPFELNNLPGLKMGFVLLPAFVAGLCGDPVVNLLRENRALDWWQANTSTPRAVILPMVGGAILTTISSYIFLENLQIIVVIAGSLSTLLCSLIIGFLQLSTNKLSRPQAVFIRLLTPILILPWSIIVNELTAYI